MKGGEGFFMFVPFHNRILLTSNENTIKGKWLIISSFCGRLTGRFNECGCGGEVLEADWRGEQGL